MKLLLMSDIHLSSRPVDEFMWDLVPQVTTILKEAEVDTLICLGDITEQKAGHSAELVNRIVDGFVEWSNHVGQIYILLGNHDLTAGANKPFFEFLKHYPKIKFITKPTEVKFLGSQHVTGLFLPHTRDPLTDWKSLDLTGKLVFAHVTVNDCIAENGQKLQSSVDSNFFDRSLVTYAGDIHKSQTMGKLTYIGSPYATKFGAHNKDFEGRIILLDTNELKDDPYGYESRLLDFPLRLTFDVSCLDDIIKEVSLMDENRQNIEKVQAKFRLHLNEQNMGRWREIKVELQNFCVEMNWKLCDIALVKDHLDTSDVVIPSSRGKYLDFDTYCNVNGIVGDLRDYGKGIVESVK